MQSRILLVGLVPCLMLSGCEFVTSEVAMEGPTVDLGEYGVSDSDAATAAGPYHFPGREPGEVPGFNPRPLRLSDIVRSTPGTAATRKVEIPKHQAVFIDQSVEMDQLMVNGKLICDPSARSFIEIKAATIHVNGVFMCGSELAPYTKKLVISLKHSAADPHRTGAYRGFMVGPQGRLMLHGNPLNSKWMRLGATARPGQSFIRLERAVNSSRDRWNVGDEIVVAPSSYAYDEAETFRIRSIDRVNPRIVHLDRPLQFQHWGEVETHVTGSRRVKLDHRAEVANLTRNIVIRSDESREKISDGEEAYGQIGGHVMLHHGGFATIDSVEFYRLGQAGIMARYPFHWHMSGNAPGQYIRNSSIHRSFQRCIVVHGTNQTRVENNVCFDFKGHGFFLEDGHEVDNVLRGNLGILARHPSPSRILLASDNPNASESGVVADRFPAVSTFWISNPRNTVTRNVAAGSVGLGFWMSFAREVRAYNHHTGRFDGNVLARPLFTDTTDFSYNVAHSTQVGITWDGAPQHGAAPLGNPNNRNDVKLATAHYHPSVVPVFRGVVAYKNWLTGIYYRGRTVVFDGAILADNGNSLFFAFNQIMMNSTVIGKTKNHGPAEEKYLYEDRRFLKRSAGALLYDGPFEFHGVDFVNFDQQRELRTVNGRSYDVTRVPFVTIGGADEYTNLVSGIRFNPVPYHSALTSHGGTGLERLRDLDGSVTGTAGAILVSYNSTSITSACVDGGTALSGFKICPPSHQDAILQFFSPTWSAHRMPFIARRNDGLLSLAQSAWNTFKSRPRTNKLSLNTLNTYQVMVPPRSEAGSPLRVESNSEKPDQGTPVTKLVGYGNSCTLSGATRVASLSALRLARTTSYYSSGNTFYFRMIPRNTLRGGRHINPSPYGIAQESDALGHAVTCQRNPVPVVSGRVGVSGLQVHGWGCDYGRTNQIEVELYAGGPPGTGTLIGRTRADRTPDASVSFACGVPSMVGHRYSFPISQETARLHDGKTIYVRGLSSSGGANRLLGKSGKFAFSCTSTSCRLVSL